MARNRKRADVERVEFWLTIVGALFGALLFPLIVMRGMDEIEAARFDAIPIPKGRGPKFWDYYNHALVFSEFQKQHPIFFSKRWSRILKKAAASPP